MHMRENRGLHDGKLCSITDTAPLTLPRATRYQDCDLPQLLCHYVTDRPRGIRTRLTLSRDNARPDTAGKYCTWM